MNRLPSTAAAQYSPAVLVEPLQPAAHHQTNSLGNVELVERQILSPLAFVVEEPALFGEMLVDLLDKEGIALGLAKKRLH